ncbi:MAG: hypothetical protein H0X27_13670 [Caulobacteraceae bacterium]|nr:hypothetical protein [Caulobacteraceae bacterium]
MKSTVIRSALLAASILGVAALSPAAASAKGLHRGLWDVGGIQQICLVSDGTWYSTTFSGWSGAWGPGTTREDRFLVYGNYAAGAGNDSMVLGGQNKADWTEWRDDLSFQNFLDDVQWTFVQKRCGPPAIQSRSGHKNPIQ